MPRPPSRRSGWDLSGWTRNLADGRVEVVAAGPVDALAELTQWLWKGPPAARVASVHVEQWLDAVPERFTVRQ